MRTWLLELLACPTCRVRLTLRADEEPDRDIESGVLTCNGCGQDYPIRGGIPWMAGGEAQRIDRRTAEHFTVEFTEVGDRGRHAEPFELREYFFYSRTGLDPDVYTAFPDDPYRTAVEPGQWTPDRSRFQGKVVLDAGTGPGRFLDVVQAAGASRVVGLDLGEHVIRAREMTAHLDNVAIVQGSVLAPPFVDDSFDIVYSIGVLHHTPDPAGGTRRLSGLVREHGDLAVWVYPPEYWGGPIRAITGKTLHAVLSRLPTRRALQVCRSVLYPLGRLQMVLARRRWSKLVGAPLFLIAVPRHPDPDVMLATIFDYFCPPIITTHDPQEVAGWMDDIRFGSVIELPVRSGVLARRRSSQHGEK